MKTCLKLGTALLTCSLVITLGLPAQLPASQLAAIRGGCNVLAVTDGKSVVDGTDCDECLRAEECDSTGVSYRCTDLEEGDDPEQCGTSWSRVDDGATTS